LVPSHCGIYRAKDFRGHSKVSNQAAKSDEHACLLSISRSVFAKENLQIVIRSLQGLGHVERASSIYRIFVEGQIHFTATILLKTQLGIDDLFLGIQALEKQYPRARAIMLGYDNEIRLTPELTVPYPRWITEAYLLVPSAEVWGDYHHAVQEESLYGLAQKLAGQPWGEFFAQGPTLLPPAEPTPL